MASNGCGLFGTLSKVWRVVSGGAPPFEACCDEHDLAYEQIENEADRRWAAVLTATGFKTMTASVKEYEV